MKYSILMLLPLAGLIAACSPDTSGSARENRATLIAQEQASVVVGMPAIKNYTEKRQLKTIYELRDTANLVTYTYTIDMNGKRHSVCPTTSVGFGFPYATQFTAPKAPRIARAPYPDGNQGEWRTYEADQPEPNGLYMPASADGTWVICLNPINKELAPTYVEPRVAAYLFEMPHVD